MTATKTMTTMNRLFDEDLSFLWFFLFPAVVYLWQRWGMTRRVYRWLDLYTRAEVDAIVKQEVAKERKIWIEITRL